MWQSKVIDRTTFKKGKKHATALHNISRHNELEVCIHKDQILRYGRVGAQERLISTNLDCMNHIAHMHIPWNKKIKNK